MNKTNLVLIIAVWVFLGCGDSNETRKAKFFFRANDHLAANEFKEAIDYYSEAILVDPDFKDAYNNRGIAHYEQGNYFDAIADYAMAIQIDTNYYEAYFNRANAFIQNQSWQRAYNDMNKIEPVYKDSIQFHFNLGLIYYGLGKYSEGVSAFTQVLEKEPQHVEALINRAAVYYSLNDLEQAESDLTTALKLDDGQANAYNLQGLIGIKKEEYELALRLFDVALNYESPNSVFINNRGFALLMAGYPDSALTDFNQSLLLNPNNAWAYRNKGIYHLEKNETEEALRLLQKARELDNTVEEINYYIGLVYLRMGLHAETCTALSRGKEVNDLRALALYEEHCLN